MGEHVRITTDGAAAVNTTHSWVPIDAATPPPLGVKLLLINKWYGVASIGVYRSQDKWTHWCGLPVFEDTE